MYDLTVLETTIWTLGISRTTLPWEALGENPTLRLPGSGGFVFLSCGYITLILASIFICLSSSHVPLLCVLQGDVSLDLGPTCIVQSDVILIYLLYLHTQRPLFLQTGDIHRFWALGHGQTVLRSQFNPPYGRWWIGLFQIIWFLKGYRIFLINYRQRSWKDIDITKNILSWLMANYNTILI